MDIYCPKCGEPWDIDTLHDVAEENDSTFDSVRVDFYARGCLALGTRHNEDVDDERAMIATVAYELSGDDIDGAASDMDDFFYLFGGG